MLKPDNPLLFNDPQAELQKLITAGRNLVKTIPSITEAVIGVSGGVDSSLSLYLSLQIFGPDHVRPFILPYADQSIAAAQAACSHLKISPRIINIKPLVQAAADLFPPAELNQLQLGNFMARSRMMILFDRASFYQALVIGTENLSEKNLGYFTLHGDAASSLEPISRLYKTQVIQLAELVFPEELAARTPSAELWPDQTDEQELGFTYAAADRVMAALWPQPLQDENLRAQLLTDLPETTINQVLARCRAQSFKQELPYLL